MSFDFPKPILVRIFEFSHETDDLMRGSLVCRRWNQCAQVACQILLKKCFDVTVKLEIAKKLVYEMTHILNSVLEKHRESLPNELMKPFQKLVSIFKLREMRIISRGPFLMSEQYTRFDSIISSIDELFPKTTASIHAKKILISTLGNLYAATTHKSISCVRHFLKQEILPLLEIQNAFLPACSTGKPPIVEMFIQHRADSRRERNPFQRETFLRAACKSGSLRSVQLLVEQGADTEEVNSEGYSPLILAAKVNVVMFRIFSAKSDSLSRVYGLEQNTIPHFAAMSKGETASIILECVSREASIDRPNADGVTPLMESIRSGNLEVFYLLIECGADIEARCHEERTPLDYAVIHKQNDCLSFLCERNPPKALQLDALKCATLNRNLSAAQILCGSLGITKVAKAASIVGVGAFALFSYFKSNED